MPEHPEVETLASLERASQPTWPDAAYGRIVERPARCFSRKPARPRTAGATRLSIDSASTRLSRKSSRTNDSPSSSDGSPRGDAPTGWLSAPSPVEDRLRQRIKQLEADLSSYKEREQELLEAADQRVLAMKRGSLRNVVESQTRALREAAAAAAAKSTAEQDVGHKVDLAVKDATDAAVAAAWRGGRNKRDCSR